MTLDHHGQTTLDHHGQFTPRTLPSPWIANQTHTYYTAIATNPPTKITATPKFSHTAGPTIPHSYLQFSTYQHHLLQLFVVYISYDQRPKTLMQNQAKR